MIALLLALACSSESPADGPVGGGGGSGGSGGGGSGGGGGTGGGAGTGGSETYVDALAALCINEFMPANKCSLPTDDGFEDWVELHNSGAVDIDLAGWSMSDDEIDPKRHVFAGGVVVPAGGFLLLFGGSGGADHVGFRLSKDGEQVGIFAPDGSGEVVSYGAVDDDRAVGRSSDCLPGNEAWIVTTGGTPGASNAGAPLTFTCPLDTAADSADTGP